MDMFLAKREVIDEEMMKNPIPMSMRDTPKVSVLAKLRGNIRKSTARMAMQVISMFPPLKRVRYPCMLSLLLPLLLPLPLLAVFPIPPPPIPKPICLPCLVRCCEGAVAPDGEDNKV